MRSCSRALVLLSVLAILLAVSPIYAVFRPAMTYNISGTAHELCLSDLNGDGKLDMIIGVVESRIETMLNNGDGTFSDGVQLDGVWSTDFLFSRDLNGDNHNDIIASLDGNQIAVFMSDGYQMYAPAITYTVGEFPEQIASADLNQDGSLDLLVACRNSSVVFVLFNDGTGAFPTRVDHTVRSPVGIATADLDNDGDADFLVSSADNTAHAFLNNGSGTMSLSWSDTTVNLSYPADRAPLAVADLNRDGFTDVVIGHEYADSLCVCLGNGNGTFQQPAIYVATFHAWSVAAADFDLDTYPDVITANFSSHSVSLFYNAGDGSLEPHQSFSFDADCAVLDVGDLDSDGDIDYAMVGRTPQIFVMLNQKIVGYLCGDANSDGQTDISDVVFLLQYIFSGGPAPASILLADVDLSNTIDISDAIYMIAHIFSGGVAPCAGK